MALTDPTSTDIDLLAKQWIVADGLVRQVTNGTGLDGSVDDLARVQHVLDAKVLRPDHTYELQCLGVAFGRVLVTSIEDMEWAIIDDEYGRDPTIRYGKTTIVFNVLTIISKRVERGEEVDVAALFGHVHTDLPRLINEAQ